MAVCDVCLRCSDVVCVLCEVLSRGSSVRVVDDKRLEQVGTTTTDDRRSAEQTSRDCQRAAAGNEGIIRTASFTSVKALLSVVVRTV